MSKFKKNKRLQELSLLLIVGIFMGGFYIYHYWWSPVPNQRLEHISLQPVGEDGFVIDLASEYGIDSDYVTIKRGYYHKDIDNHWSSKDFRPVDFVKVDLYRPEDKGKLYKTIDVLTAVQAYNKNYQPVIDGFFGIYEDRKTGERYIRYTAYDMREMSPDWEWSGDGLEVHDLYVNIETEKVVSKIEIDPVIPSQTSDNFIFQKKTTTVHKKPIKVKGVEDYLLTYEFSNGADFTGTRLVETYPEVVKLLSC